MRKILLLITLLTTTLTHGQVDLNQYDEIVLVDYQNWNYQRYHGRTYLIKLDEKPIKLYDMKILTGMDLFELLRDKYPDRLKVFYSISPDSTEKRSKELKRLIEEYKSTPDTIKEIEPKVIHRLKSEFLRITKREHILNELQLTSDSIQFHLNDYLLKYLSENKIKYKPENLYYCKNKLKDYDLFRKTAMSLTHGNATSDYPTVSIEFRNSTDTLLIYSIGQHPFMLPWLDRRNNEYSYNPNLSKELGLLLPDYQHSNRDRLLGERGILGDYLTVLFYNTIRLHCINEKKKLITK
jgi:hypothetical protein